MARSKVSVINKALTKLAVDRITSENETNKRAVEARASWDDVLEEVLGSYNWNFATRRQALAQVTTTPAFGYDYAYRLPTTPKCIKVRDLYADSQTWSKGWVIEGDDSGGLLLTNYTTASIRYTALVTNPDLWSPWFTEVFATRLAAELCLALRNSRSLKETLMNEYLMKIDEAGVIDGQESGNEVPDDEHQYPERDWVSVRFSDGDRVEGDV